MNSFVVSLRSIFTGRLIVKRLINCCLITAFNLVRYKARWRDRGLGAGWAGLKLTISVYLDGGAGGGDLLLLPGHNYQNPGCHFRPIIARGELWEDHPCPPAHSAQQRFVINKAEIALFIHAGGRQKMCPGLVTRADNRPPRSFHNAWIMPLLRWFLVEMPTSAFTIKNLRLLVPKNHY